MIKIIFITGFNLLLASNMAFAAPTGKELFEERCTRCHQLPKPDDLTGGKWSGRVDQMVDFSDLSGKEKMLLLKHIQQLVDNR